MRLLNRIVTRDMAKAAVGQVFYTPWCDEDGKVIDDGTIHRLDEQVYRLTAADPTLLWLEDNALGLSVEIADESDEVGALALQGPNARAILQSMTKDDLSSLRYYRLMHTRVAGMSVTISRTGYTGDLGYEVWRPSSTPSGWDALIEAGTPFGITPAGMLAGYRPHRAGLPIEVDYVRHAMR
jgi:aminomethyltransferase